MKTVFKFSALFSLAAILGCGSVTMPARNSANNSPPSRTSTDEKRPADNTGVNKRDRDPEAKTPIDQKENQADVQTTADIRKRVVAEENMSTNAQNVKIITADGKVTLRGPVDSAAERDAINAIATEIAGKDNVDNQLEVASN